ncbi:uncharacterized protein [Aquarana catesbeiana]|uniref:uncharacterized protein n=1 Tax=Aquarana catesbeiana TaxID=8400 RepID=UPI003CC9E151
MDMDELRHAINNFSFDRCKGGNQGFNRILIQLFGWLGHGMSSFINTCVYIWQDGEYQSWAKAERNFTWERIEHKLTNNITLVDNRGLSTMDSYEIGEIYAQLGNLLPLGQAVEWTKGFKLVNRILKSEKLVKYSDFIVPVYVHSARRTIYPEEMNELENVFKAARRLTGVCPIVVLTHKSSGNVTDTEKMFRDMGVDKIFLFENCTSEDHVKTRGRHEEVLKFLYEVIKDVQFAVEHQPQDPVKESIERKNFVMSYINKCELQAKQEEIEVQRALERVRLEKKKEEEEEEEEIKRQKERERQDQAMEEELQAEQERLRKKEKKKWKLFR